MPDGSVLLSVFGLTVRIILIGDRSVLAQPAIERAWSRCLAAPDAGTGGSDVDLEIPVAITDEILAVRADHPDAVIAQDEADLLHQLSPAVTTRCIERRAGELYMLHACGIAFPDGGVVAFIAASGTGKTTLARALGGFNGYVSDETVAIGLDGSVIAYPKPLSVIVDPATPRKDQWSPDEIGLAVAPEGLFLAGVVLLDRDAGGPRVPVIEELPLLHGLVTMTEQTSALTRLEAPLQTAARLVEAAGGIRRVRYSEATTLVPFIDRMRGGAR